MQEAVTVEEITMITTIIETTTLGIKQCERSTNHKISNKGIGKTMSKNKKRVKIDKEARISLEMTRLLYTKTCQDT